MKSPVIKRSIVIAGHKTSVSLEDAFWKGLKDIAAGRRTTLSDLVAAIDSERRHGNLSSAIRLFVLDHYQARTNGHADSGHDKSQHGDSVATPRETIVAARRSPLSFAAGIANRAPSAQPARRCSMRVVAARIGAGSAPPPPPSRWPCRRAPVLAASTGLITMGAGKARQRRRDRRFQSPGGLIGHGGWHFRLLQALHPSRSRNRRWRRFGGIADSTTVPGGTMRTAGEPGRTTGPTASVAPIGLDRFETAGLQLGGAQRQPAGQRRNIERALRRRERAFDGDRKFRPRADQGIRRRGVPRASCARRSRRCRDRCAPSSETSAPSCACSVAWVRLTAPAAIVTAALPCGTARRPFAIAALDGGTGFSPYRSSRSGRRPAWRRRTPPRRARRNAHPRA